MLLLGVMILVGVFRTTWWEIAAVAAGVGVLSLLMALVFERGADVALWRFLTSFATALAVGYAARFVTFLIAGSPNAPGRTSRVSGLFGERRKK